MLRSQKELGEFLEEHSLDRITTHSAWQAVGSSAYVVAVEGRDVADARKLNANLNMVTLSPLRSNGVFIVVIAGEPTLAVKMR